MGSRSWRQRDRAAIMFGIVVVLVLSCAAPDQVAAYEGPYSRAGTYDVFVAIPAPGWKSPYPLVEGVPEVEYPAPIGTQRNPVTTAQYGLARWSTGVEFGDAEEIEVAKQVGLWLVQQQQPDGEWLYEFPFSPAPVPVPELTLEPPWASALAQAQAISLLTRLYRYTHESLYLTAAEKALQPLLKPVAEGGLASSYEGGVWLEEYPTPKPVYTLNGFLMSIVGVYDLADLDPAAQALFEQTVSTAAKSLPAFDTGRGTSWYDLEGLYGLEQYEPPPYYGPTIVRTLELLNTLSPHEAFLHYAKIWTETPAEVPPSQLVPPTPPPPEEPKPPPVPDAELASTEMLASAAGRLRLRVTCPVSEVVCRGTVTLRSAKPVSFRRKGRARKRILTLAAGSFAIAGGRVSTVTLDLSAQALRLLRHVRVMRVRATIVAHDTAGGSHTSQTVVTLRIRRAGARRLEPDWSIWREWSAPRQGASGISCQTAGRRCGPARSILAVGSHATREIHTWVRTGFSRAKS